MGDTTGYSKENFEKDVDELLLAFERYESEPSFALCDWRPKHDDWGSLYLLHPPVTLLSTGTISQENNQVFGEQQDLESDLEEEGILEDDHCYHDETNNAKNIDAEQLEAILATQWTFSIVYSTTYRSPVLYFSVQESSGNPVRRQTLLKLLRQEHKRSAFEESNDFPTDEWEFVSQEEQPITGIVSFFLHPCQSSHRLKLLTTPADSKSGDKDADNSTSMNVLWTWMSMILPAVGHSIPSAYFRHIQNCIAEQK